MAVGLKVKFNWYQIGESELLYPFFSTIAYNLENNIWGSKFPTIMIDLYQGKVDVDKLQFVEQELQTIRNELSLLPVNKLIWNIDDLSKMPPWETNISKDIRNLSDYYVTSDGNNLLDVLFKAINKAKELKSYLEISSI